MDSPRGRIQLMEANLDGTISLNPTVIGHFDHCLGCMACVTACPSGVQYDRLIEATRETIETETAPALRRPVRARARSSSSSPTRAGWARPCASRRSAASCRCPGRLGAMTEIAPPWRSTERPERITPAGGETRGRVGILTGCVQSVVFGSVNAATARVLAADGYEVVAPPQGCCGALSMHAGPRRRGARVRAPGDRGVRRRRDGDRQHLRLRLAPEGARARARRRSRLGRARRGVLGPRARPRRVPAASVEPRARRHPLNLKVAMQDSCHLRHAQRLPLSSAVSLRRIPGPHGRRARRAGHLLRQRRHLQHHPARGGPASSATARRRTCSRPGRRSTRAPTPAASSRSRRRCGAPEPAAGAAPDRDRRCVDPEPRRGGPAAQRSPLSKARR